MLDERWSEDVEDIGSALHKRLALQSTPERVRAAEALPDGRDRELEASLVEFGLRELDGSAELFARVAFELGRALATCAVVETLPVLAVLGRPEISYGFEGLVPASIPHIAVCCEDAVYVEPLSGNAARSAAGDLLVAHHPSGTGERVGDGALASRIRRFADLVDGARMVGAGQRLLEYGVDYARARHQFGKPIGGYQGIAHQLADAAILLDSAELLVRKAAFTAAPEVGGDSAPAAAFAIMVRAKAVEAARAISSTVHQVFGGYGFAMEYDVQLYSRRLRSWAMRGSRPSGSLTDLGRMVLDPAARDAIHLLWHYDRGVTLPRWAREADAPHPDPTLDRSRPQET